MILFADRGCPFAHRVLALLELLGASLDLRESIVGDKPEGLYHYSSSGSMPLLVDGELILTESRVMLEHLAEHFSFTDAYPEDLISRSRHRRVMSIVDNFFAPLLFGHTTATVDGRQLEDALRSLEEIAYDVPRPNLLSLHIAPIWLRFQMWHPGHVVTHAINARDTLCQWLNAATQIDCLKRTLPDTTIILADLALARRLALLPE
jgi:glutathione S-transferase